MGLPDLEQKLVLRERVTNVTNLAVTLHVQVDKNKILSVVELVRCLYLHCFIPLEYRNYGHFICFILFLHCFNLLLIRTSSFDLLYHRFAFSILLLPNLDEFSTLLLQVALLLFLIPFELDLLGSSRFLLLLIVSIVVLLLVYLEELLPASLDLVHCSLATLLLFILLVFLLL